MASLKYTFFVLLIFVALFFLWALSLPSVLHVKQSKTYQSDTETLFAEISDFHEWIDWFPWMDESMEFDIVNAKASATHRLSWQHPVQGNGFIEITSIKPPHEIQQVLQFDESSEIMNSSFQFIEKQTGGTEVVWTIYQPESFPYPLGRVRAFVIRKMSKKQMLKALDDIPFNF